MTDRNRYNRQLRLIECGLLGPDPRLAAQLNVFSRLTAGQGMPAWEQVPSRSERIRAVTLTARSLAVAVVGVLLSTCTKTRRRNARTSLDPSVNDD